MNTQPLHGRPTALQDYRVLLVRDEPYVEREAIVQAHSAAEAERRVYRDPDEGVVSGETFPLAD